MPTGSFYDEQQFHQAGPGENATENWEIWDSIKNKGLCDRLCDGTYHNLPITA